MSRTIPDLHLRKIRDSQNPWGADTQVPKKPRFSTDQSRDTATEKQQAPKVNRSGEVFVTQGANNRLIFKATTFHGPRPGEKSCGFQQLKDGTRVCLHLCWHFWNSDFHSKETKDLLIALDRVVRILKELDCYHVQQAQEADLDSERNGGGSVADFDSILNLGEMNFAPESARHTRPRFYNKVESTPLQDALFENGDLPTPETIRESNVKHVHSPPMGNGKRRSQCESMENGNLPRIVPEREDISRRERNARGGLYSIGSERKKKMSEAKPDIAHERKICENGNKVRDALPQQHPKLRSFLRDRELKKRARESILDSARKTAFDSAMRYDQGMLRDYPQKDASVSDKGMKTGRDSRADVDREKAGKAAFDVKIGRENVQSTFGLHRQRQRMTLVDGGDETNVFGTNTESPLETDVVGCSSESDVEIISGTSVRGKDVECGASAISHRNNVNCTGRKEFRSGRGDDSLKKDNVSNIDKERNTVSFRNRKASQLQHKEGNFNFSVPKVDEFFYGSHWKSMDERERVSAILTQFHYLEEYFRSKYQNGADGRHPLRPDLKSGQYLLSRGFCFNQGFSVVGAIPGVTIGQCFRYREELLLLTIHRPQQAGIDYISASKSDYRDSNGKAVAVAVSIVASGGYRDNQDDGKTTLIYSGQGGNSNKTQRIKNGKSLQDHDQELVRGNLALVNSYKLQVPVRVTRGIKANDQGRKLYVYDGLYDVKNFYEETGSSGFKVWKFKLIKQGGQPVSSVSKFLAGEEVGDDV